MIALRRWGAHIRKSGFIVHVSGTSKELVRIIAAILAHVQFHISLLYPNCASRCYVVSMASQVLHRFVSVSLIAVRRSLVGMRSWISMYHFDRWTSEIHAVWRLVHRRFQFTSGYLRRTRIKPLLSVLLCMSLSIPYIRLLCLLMVSFVRCEATYAMSSAYWRTCTSLLGILFMFEGFSTVSFMFHFLKRAAVAETFCAANILILPRRSARQCPVAPIHLILPVSGGSLWGHGRWHLSKQTTYRSISAVGCGVSVVVELVPGTKFWLRGRFLHIVPGGQATSCGRKLFLPRAYCISYFCPTLPYSLFHSGSKCHPKYCDLLA